MHFQNDSHPLIKMTNNSTSEQSVIPPVWLLLNYYGSYFVGGAFALTALLAIGFLLYLFFYRAKNQHGALLSAIFIIAFLFSSSRSLLIVDNLVPSIQRITSNLDSLRLPSVCSLFALLFVAIVRSSEPIFTRTYFVTKFACLACLILNYAIAFTPFLMEKYYTGYADIARLVQAAVGMYFITILSVMGLAYAFMLPKMLTTARDVKLAGTAPSRLISSAIFGFLSAILLIIYVLFLLLGFILIQPGFQIDFGQKWRDNSIVLQQLQAIGSTALEALLTLIMVISTILLVKTDKYPESSLTSAPEMQGLLYPGQDSLASRQPIILGKGTNGYHTLSKLDYRSHYGK